MSDISLTVLDDMRLMISPAEVARDAEHNSAMFKITQPPALDQYACRAEVETAGGMTYRAVTAGEFALTNDIAVRGLGRLQLVYSDGVDVMRKTSVAAFHVTGSLNALDQSAPGFGDGLAQVQDRAYAQVGITGGNILVFYNIAGLQRGTVTIPGAGGIEEVPAPNGAYARVRSGGGGGTTSWQDFATLRIAGLDSPQFAGSPTTSPTPPVGDSGPRLANTEFVARDFLARAGGQMSGPLITMMGGGPTNPGIGIGDNTTGFYRSGNLLVTTLGGAIVAQVQPTIAAYFIPLDMGNQRVSNVADATLDQDALNRRTGDGRYLRSNGGTMGGVLSFTPNQGIAFQPGLSVIYETAAPHGLTLRQAAGNLGVWIEDNDSTPASRRRILVQGDALTPSGGQLTGTLTTVPGTGQNDLGLGIGDINTGFYRSGTGAGADLFTLVAGYPMLMLTAAREAIINGPLSMAMNRIFQVGDATGPTDVLNRQSGDARYLQQAGADTRYLQLAAGGIIAGPVQVLQTPVLPNDATNKTYVDAQVAGVVSPTALRTFVFTPNQMAISGTAQSFLDVNVTLPATGLRNVLVSIDPLFYSADTANNWSLIYAINLIALEVPMYAYKLATENTQFLRATAKFMAVVDATAGQIRLLATVYTTNTPVGNLIQVGANSTAVTNMRTLVSVQDLGPVGSEEMQ
jgi:hypothetical protein